METSLGTTKLKSMNRENAKIKKVVFKKNEGLIVDYTHDVKFNKKDITDEDSTNSDRPKHDDLIAFEDIIKRHACKHNLIAGIYGVDFDKLNESKKQAYEEFINEIVMNSITFSIKEDGTIYAVIIAAKMKSFSGNVNIVTPNIQLQSNTYPEAAELNDAVISFVNEVELWLDGKSGELTLFDEPEKEEKEEPELMEAV